MSSDTLTSALVVEWLDAGREPRSPPDKRFPNGVDADVSLGAAVTCATPLPYPAKRCGQYVITCPTCDVRVMVTTAGRVDDPRSVKIACLRRSKEKQN
jgi:hypothetical protein